MSNSTTTAVCHSPSSAPTGKEAKLLTIMPAFDEETLTGSVIEHLLAHEPTDGRHR